MTMMPPMFDGVVVTAWSGWYVVETASGRLLCRPRGRLRPRVDRHRELRAREHAEGLSDPEEPEEEDGEEPTPVETGPRHARGGGHLEAEAEEPGILAGDRVHCTDLGGGEGRIEVVLPRAVTLTRPPVANVDQAIVVTAWTEPPFSPAFVDRLLVAVAREGCVAAICLNKIDRLEPDQRAQAIADLSPYRMAGYDVLLTSARTGEGMAELAVAVRGKVSVLAGPSGSGKSALLGRLCPDRPPRSAAISPRLGRGRHTTRHVELLRVPTEGPPSWVADTPGFSRLDLEGLAPEDLGRYYPEFLPLADGCRFHGCLHEAEPGCAVIAAVEAGVVDPGRHARYLESLAEVRQHFRVF